VAVRVAVFVLLVGCANTPVCEWSDTGAWLERCGGAECYAYCTEPGLVCVRDTLGWPSCRREDGTLGEVTYTRCALDVVECRRPGLVPVCACP